MLREKKLLPVKRFKSTFQCKTTKNNFKKDQQAFFWFDFFENSLFGLQLYRRIEFEQKKHGYKIESISKQVTLIKSLELNILTQLSIL